MTIAIAAATLTCMMQLQRRIRNAPTQTRSPNMQETQRKLHGPTKMGNSRRTPQKESTKQNRDVFRRMSNSNGDQK